MVHVLAFDPSGNYHEGSGITGIAHLIDGRLEKLSQIEAKQYDCRESYWDAHIQHLQNYFLKAGGNLEVVMESYQLYHHRGQQAQSQAHSFLETPQLIGAISYICWKNGIPLTLQAASQVKKRWADSILVYEGVIEKKGNRHCFNGTVLNSHKKDALRHALHYWRYNREKRRLKHAQV